jgi:uncharacterized protein involved in exopolysaccharide biosynthesis
MLMADPNLQNAHKPPLLNSAHRNADPLNPSDPLSDRPLRPYIRFTVVFLTAVLVGLAIWPFIPRRYEAYATLILRANEETGALGHSQALKQMLDEGAVQSELDIISSLPLSNEVMERLDLARDPEFNSSSWAAIKHEKDISDPAREIANHVIVSRDRKSYTVKLGYWSKDPAKAALMANALASAYLDRQIKFKLERNAELKEQMESRLVELASRGGIIPKIVDVVSDSDNIISRSGNFKNATLVEFETVRQRLVAMNELRSEIHPDAERVSDALLPLGPSFPNPLLMTASTVLIALIASLLSIRQEIGLAFSGDLRNINEARSHQ